MKYKIIPMSEKEKTLKSLRGECWHEIVKRGEFGGVRCINCDHWGDKQGKSLGWFCPNSPDHICHYKSVYDYPSGLRYVISINGEKIILKNYSGKHESLDWCIFCDEPEERK